MSVSTGKAFLTYIVPPQLLAGRGGGLRCGARIAHFRLGLSQAHAGRADRCVKTAPQVQAGLGEEAPGTVTGVLGPWCPRH